MKRFVLFLAVFSSFAAFSYSQIHDPVSWKYHSKRLGDNLFELQFEATIEKGWHMYGLNIPQNGPVPTSFTFTKNSDIEFQTKLTSREKPEIKFDSTFEMDLELFSNHVLFTRKVKVLSEKDTQVEGSLEFMACDDSRCLPPKEVGFTVSLKNTTPKASSSADKAAMQNSTDNDQQESDTVLSDPSHSVLPAARQDTIKVQDNSIARTSDEKNYSLFRLFLLALLAGFGAILTPCVYPIIPLTVTYFMRNTTRTKSILNGLFFGFSIVVIYTLVGLLVGLTKIDLVRLVSSHWLPNLVFFLIFLALAFSFFGMFEIVLPSGLSNKIDRQADAGGLFGPFFMALATVVISFSCTGPIVGVVLGGALQGELIRPMIGMLGFSLSFALPFTLLAIFPGTLKNLPKSGSWLNTVKVFFAFIMLAFSLVFLGNLGLAFFTRQTILILASVIFLLLGLYLLGVFRFSHDNALPHISVVRLILVIMAWFIAIYLLTGLNGTSLKKIEPFLPANEKALIPAQSSANQFINSTSKEAGLLCTDKPLYSDILQFPFGLKGYFDYDEALACARQLNKPVLLDFAGHYCKNCKKMYAEVWSDPVVKNILQSDFVLATLYTDDRTELPQQEWITSALDGKVKKTLGKKFNDLQISKFGTNALPLYVIVDGNGKILTQEKYYAYSSSVDNFIHFLQEGASSFNSMK
jgi:thiol:disulfide interchange protein